jgi:hypothetical protein
MLMIAIVILFLLAIAWDRTLAATILHGNFLRHRHGSATRGASNGASRWSLEFARGRLR